MAHPCFSCGSECDCSGDWDDVIVGKTPMSCEGCGCDDFDNWGDDDCEGPFDDDNCPACGYNNGNHMKGCPEDNSPFAELCRNGYD